MEEKRSGRHLLDERTSENLLSAIHGLAAQSRAALPPEDLEARLLARAEAQNLLAEPVKVPAAGREPAWQERPWRKQRRLWIWAPVAAAACAVLLWTGVAFWREAAAPAPSLPQRASVAPAPTVPPGEESGKNDTASTEMPPSKPTTARDLTAKASPVSGATQQERRGPESRKAAPVTMASVQPSGGATEAAEPAGSESAPIGEEFAYSAFMPVSTAPELRMDEFAQTVRVRVEPEDLWRLGLPVPPMRLRVPGGEDNRVLADFLVGEDGRPRAIRLVSNTRE